MKQRGFLLILLILTVLLSSTGCGRQPAETGSAGEKPFYSFTDHTGQTITLSARPRKVAVLFSSFAEVWRLAGGETAITVGESVERGFCGDTVQLVDQGAGKTIDRELLIACQPDFVIASADLPAQSETAQFLNESGIPAALFRVECFDEYLEMLKICTDITGNTEALTQYGTQVQERIDTLLSQVAGSQSSRRILFIRSGSGASSAKAKTAEDHFAAAMLKELGTYNIAENAPVLLDGLSLEEILRENPSYIFISTMGDEAAAKAYMESVFAGPAWQALEAVAQKNYVFLPKDLFQYKPNAAWDQAYAYLAEILYPELISHAQ